MTQEPTTTPTTKANPGDLVKTVTNMFLSWGAIKDASRVQYYIDKGEVLFVTKVDPDVTYRHPLDGTKENYVVYELIHDNNIVSSWICHSEIKDDPNIFESLFKKIKTDLSTEEEELEESREEE